MAFRPFSTSIVICLLLAAALACLMAAFQLLGGGEALGRVSAVVITALGGLVVFLLGAAGLMTIRRYFVPRTARAPLPSVDLPVADVTEWRGDLTSLRDDLRRDGAAAERLAEYRDRELTVPGSFRPRGQYLLGADGHPADPLDDLKRTRDQLLDAAARVDAIVQGIDQATVPSPPPSLLARMGLRQLARRLGR